MAKGTGFDAGFPKPDKVLFDQLQLRGNKIAYGRVKTWAVETFDNVSAMTWFLTPVKDLQLKSFYGSGYTDNAGTLEPRNVHLFVEPQAANPNFSEQPEGDLYSPGVITSILNRYRFGESSGPFMVNLVLRAGNQYRFDLVIENVVLGVNNDLRAIIEYYDV
jgi:hypothetical protein